MRARRHTPSSPHSSSGSPKRARAGRREPSILATMRRLPAVALSLLTLACGADDTSITTMTTSSGGTETSAGPSATFGDTMTSSTAGESVGTSGTTTVESETVATTSGTPETTDTSSTLDSGSTSDDSTS